MNEPREFQNFSWALGQRPTSKIPTDTTLICSNLYEQIVPKLCYISQSFYFLVMANQSRRYRMHKSLSISREFKLSFGGGQQKEQTKLYLSY